MPINYVGVLWGVRLRDLYSLAGFFVWVLLRLCEERVFFFARDVFSMSVLFS